jgi:hypothetical protein
MGHGITTPIGCIDARIHGQPIGCGCTDARVAVVLGKPESVARGGGGADEPLVPSAEAPRENFYKINPRTHWVT